MGRYEHNIHEDGDKDDDHHWVRGETKNQEMDEDVYVYTEKRNPNTHSTLHNMPGQVARSGRRWYAVEPRSQPPFPGPKSTKAVQAKAGREWPFWLFVRGFI